MFFFLCACNLIRRLSNNMKASNEGAAILSYMALAWNLPVIIPRGNDENIRNLSYFPNIVALHPLDKVEVSRFLMTICKKYGWKRVSLLVDSDLTVMSTTATVVQL